MKNVIFAGVGGQGVILASKILLEVAKNSGYDVKESEIHGMAQRGGSVDCHVRYGEKVHSPLIEKGTADFIVTFEILESMRKLEYLAQDGVLITNNLQIDPTPVEIGAMEYPADIYDWISKNIKKSKIVETKQTLKDVGSARTLNVVMLGVLSNYLEFNVDEWENAIKNQVKNKFIDMNVKAFHLGKEL